MLEDPIAVVINILIHLLPQALTVLSFSFFFSFQIYNIGLGLYHASI